MRPISRTQVIEGKRYSTDTATLLAGNDFWDGHNHERGGTNLFLFRTPRGRFFLQHRSQWQGADDGSLEALTEAEAQEWYEQLREKRVDFEDAFPGTVVEEA